MNESMRAMSFFPSRARRTPSLAPKPDENTRQSSQPVKAARADSSSLCRSMSPPMMGAAHTPVPYFSTAETPAAMVSAFLDIPR